METDLTEEQRRQLLLAGQDARALLGDERLARAINDVREWMKDQILRTAPDDTRTRESLYFQAVGIDNLIDTLQQRVWVMDQLIEAERLKAEEKNDDIR